MDGHMAALGADWGPLADIGGHVTTVRDVAARWPADRLVMRLARHYSAMVDGAVHDTWAQHPEKRVYGVWVMAATAPNQGDER